MPSMIKPVIIWHDLNRINWVLVTSNPIGKIKHLKSIKLILASNKKDGISNNSGSLLDYRMEGMNSPKVVRPVGY